MTPEQLDEAAILARIGIQHNRPRAVQALAEALGERCRRTARMLPTWAEKINYRDSGVERCRRVH